MLSLVSLSNERIYMYFVFLRRIKKRVIWLFTLDLLVYSKGYAARWIFKFILFSFKLMEETLKYILHKVNQSILTINFHFISQSYAKMSEYRAVELSSSRTIELSNYRVAYPYDSIFHQAVVEHILSTMTGRISNVF